MKLLLSGEAFPFSGNRYLECAPFFLVEAIPFSGIISFHGNISLWKLFFLVDAILLMEAIPLRRVILFCGNHFLMETVLFSGGDILVEAISFMPFLLVETISSSENRFLLVEGILFTGSHNF